MAILSYMYCMYCLSNVYLKQMQATNVLVGLFSLRCLVLLVFSFHIIWYLPWPIFIINNLTFVKV